MLDEKQQWMKTKDDRILLGGISFEDPLKATEKKKVCQCFHDNGE